MPWKEDLQYQLDAMKRDTKPLGAHQIASLICLIRGQRIILDADLLEFTETRVLVQAIKRNGKRFPQDFLFRLAPQETASLRSQIVILKAGRGRHRKYPPYAFTEHGG